MCGLLDISGCVGCLLQKRKGSSRSFSKYLHAQSTSSTNSPVLQLLTTTSILQFLLLTLPHKNHVLSKQDGRITSSMILTATRSFTLPPGFRNSAFPRICNRRESDTIHYLQTTQNSHSLPPNFTQNNNSLPPNFTQNIKAEQLK